MMHPPLVVTSVAQYNGTSPTQTLHITTNDSQVPAVMREEVTAAVEFLLRLVETPRLSPALPNLGQTLANAMVNKFKDHWFLETPHRGQAFRCIEVCDQQADRILSAAAEECGLHYSELRLPAELCVWIDPNEVACRFGDELGSFLPIFINDNGKKTSFIDRFDFKRLCERPVVTALPPHSGRINNMQYERYNNNRVVNGTVELMDVDSDHSLPQASFLTPPQTPPPSQSSPSSCSSSPSTLKSSFSSSSPSPILSSPPPLSKPLPPPPTSRPPLSRHLQQPKTTRVTAPPSHLPLNSSSTNSSSRASPTSPIYYPVSSPPSTTSPTFINSSFRPHNNIYNTFIYNNNNLNNNNNMYGGGNANQGYGVGRSPLRSSTSMSSTTTSTSGGLSKLSSKWGPYNFPSTTPGGLPTTTAAGAINHHHHQNNHHNHGGQHHLHHHHHNNHHQYTNNSSSSHHNNHHHTVYGQRYGGGAGGAADRGFWLGHRTLARA